MNFKKVSFVLGILVISLFTFSDNLHAQCNAKFTASTVNGKQNDEVKVNITVDNFTDLSVFQWTMRWDPAVLEFKSIGELDLPDLTLSSFNTTKSAQGFFTTSWFFQQAATKANGSKIFTITFKIIGADGKTSGVDFSDTPLKREFADKNSQVCNNIVTTNGRVNSGTVINPPVGLTLKIGKINASKDEEVCVPVSVLGFSKITAMQFSFGWDTSRIKFTKLQKFSGLTQFESSSFGLNNAVRGQLSSVWIDQATLGQTVADNIVIFEVCFKYTGPCPGSGDITITDIPTRTSFVSTTGTLALTKENGSITASQCTAGISLSTASVSHPCAGQNNGAITLNAAGGTAPLTYTWTNGATTKDITGLGAGTYNVTVRDASGSSASLSAAIVLSSLAVTAQSTNPTSGQNNGSVTLTVTGGNPTITYAWSNNATTKDINNLPAGSYTYTVKDGNNCTVTGSVSIGDVPLGDPTVTPVSPACNGASTGSINVTISGGKAPLTYAWTGPSNFTSTTEDITGLKAGTYKLTIKDANNVTKTTNDITLSDPAAFKVTGNVNTVTSLGNDGEISLTVSGGTAPYTYRWADGSTQQNRTLLSVGNYSVTATDSKGCTASAAFNVSANTGACFTSARVFTPNNDGINDLFVISCASNISNQLQVFNRWNQLVYSTNDYRNDWNGVSKSGTLLQDGTYYWILRDNATNILYKGYVALIRSLN